MIQSILTPSVVFYPYLINADSATPYVAANSFHPQTTFVCAINSALNNKDLSQATHDANVDDLVNFNTICGLLLLNRSSFSPSLTIEATSSSSLSSFNKFECIRTQGLKSHLMQLVVYFKTHFLPKWVGVYTIRVFTSYPGNSSIYRVLGLHPNILPYLLVLHLLLTVYSSPC